jgi:hypothetical protein
VRHPESLAVIDQQADGRRPSTPEDEQPAGERIGLEFLPAHGGQPVDSLSQIHGLHCHQHAHLRRDLDHRPPFRQARNNRWKSTAPVTGIRKPSMHAAGVINTSTNSGRASVVRGAATFSRLRKAA